MIRKRGFLLITALLVCVILLLIGMGMLGSESSRYAAMRHAATSSQARQMALAGLEDARAKLELDASFPPDPGPGQTTFSYSERLDLDSNTSGTYSVTIDRVQAGTPAAVLVVTSVGSIGPISKPIAQYKLRAEMDLSQSRPAAGNGIQSNRYFRWTHIQDEEMP